MIYDTIQLGYHLIKYNKTYGIFLKKCEKYDFRLVSTKLIVC